MTDLVIAADIGGTHIRAAIVTRAGQVAGRRERPTPAGASSDAILDAIGELLATVLASSGYPVGGICLATPGLIDADAGKVILAPNIAGFRNLTLTTPLAARLLTPVFIENDASAAALGEHRFGAGRGTRHLLHATLGTGIGGGIVIDRKLYRGARGFAGEIGHVVIDPAGPRCNCGSRGCLEAMVSGVAFAERARRIVAAGTSTILSGLAAGAPPTAEQLFAAAQRGDELCEAEIRHGGHLLGLGLGGIVNVLNPDMVTLSGGLLHMGDMLLGPLREAMFSIAYGPASGTLLKTTELDDNAGLLGAAAVAFERLDG